LAPKRLIESGYIREYVSGKWGYRLYYPTVWQIDTVDNTSGQVLVSTITGDFIDVQVFETAGDSFATWFAAHAEKQIFSSLEKKTNRFDIEGYVRRDGLVAYIPTKDRVYVMIYHPGVENIVYYPYVMNMMFQSFRITTEPVEMPEQTILPEPPIPFTDVTTTTTATSTAITTTTTTAITDTTTSTIETEELQVGASCDDGLGFVFSSINGNLCVRVGETVSDTECVVVANGGCEFVLIEEGSQTEPEPQVEPQVEPQEEPQTEPEQVSITIANFAFSPETQTIAAGDSVTWSQQDSAPHTIVADDGSFSTQTLNTGDSFSFTFNTPGTYVYHCGIHPSMIGTIVVE
jgi:plastocyanin